MREALALVGEEGLEAMWSRHQAMHDKLWEGLRGMGLQPFVENEQVSENELPQGPAPQRPAVVLAFRTG